MTMDKLTKLRISREKNTTYQDVPAAQLPMQGIPKKVPTICCQISYSAPEPQWVQKSLNQRNRVSEAEAIGALGLGGTIDQRLLSLSSSSSSSH